MLTDFDKCAVDIALVQFVSPGLIVLKDGTEISSFTGDFRDVWEACRQENQGDRRLVPVGK